MLWLLASLAVLGTGLYGLVYAVNAYRRYRYMVNLPTSTVRAAAMGMTEVKGRAVSAGETITSPFEEEPCLLCHYLCLHGEEEEEEGTLEAGTLGVPFYVEDETGRLLVRPDGAEVKLPDHLTKLSTELLNADDTDGARKATPATVQRFLEQKRNGGLPHLHSGRAALLKYLSPGVVIFLAGPPEKKKRAKTIRLGEGPDVFGEDPHYVEARLEEGDEVYVLGHAQSRQAEAVAAGDAAINERNLFIGEASGSSGPFWSNYASIFEIASGSEEDLVGRSRREVKRQMRLGFLAFVAGLFAFLLLMANGCAG